MELNPSELTEFKAILAELGINELKPIMVTFKKNREDTELYVWLSKKNGKGTFIKDVLREKMESEKKIDKKNKPNIIKY